MTLDEYIRLRLKQDNLPITEYKKKNENMQICINYVFEYFNLYVTGDKLQEARIEKSKKLENYSKTINDFNDETKMWFLSVFEKHNKKININIRRVLDKNPYFLLYNKESEFRKTSYKCYSELIKKNDWLEDYSEELYEAIIEFHRIQSNNYSIGERSIDVIAFNEKYKDILINLIEKEHIDLAAWASAYAEYYFEQNDKWPKNAVVDEGDNCTFYDVTRVKKNVFDLDSVFANIGNNNLLKGYRKLMEALVMEYWYGSIMGEKYISSEYYKEFMTKRLK